MNTQTSTARFSEEQIAEYGKYYDADAMRLANKIDEGIRKLPALQRRADSECVAKAIHEVLREQSKACGQSPDTETFYKVSGPEGQRTYHVSWESGPHQWAQLAWEVVYDLTGRLAEPYYSFDLQLYDIE